jgi:hypothetical protein
VELADDMRDAAVRPVATNVAFPDGLLLEPGEENGAVEVRKTMGMAATITCLTV